MLESTEKIIAETEEVSGFPVHVEADSSLETSATVKMAQEALNTHLI